MPIPSGFGQVNYRFSGAGAPSGAEVTFGFTVPGGDDPTTAGGDLITAWNATDMPDLYSLSLTFEEVLVKFGPDATGPSAVTPAGGAGGLGAAGGPQQAYLVHKHTALGGRQGRGRFYIPGVAEADVDPSGTILAARITAATTILEDFRALVALGGRELVLLHRDGSTPTAITSMTMDAKVATQRRRNRR